MFCPSCGTERLSDATSFCSRCGFLLTGTAILLQAGGSIPQINSANQTSSPRTRGIKRGLFIFLLSFVVVPIIAIISVALDMEPWGIPISAILLFVGGLLRMAYAAMFESASPDALKRANGMNPQTNVLTDRGPAAGSLSASTASPATEYPSPTARETRTPEFHATSVTEDTTKLLKKREMPQ